MPHARQELFGGVAVEDRVRSAGREAQDDRPGPEMDDWLRKRGVTYPVYYDLDREAREAFGVSAISASFVLDPEGRVRFAHSHTAEIRRQLEALGLLGEVVPSPPTTGEPGPSRLPVRR